MRIATIVLLAAIAVAPVLAQEVSPAPSIPAPEPPPLDMSAYTFDKDIAYGSQSPKQVLDILYRTEHDDALRPAIIHIHGGGWYTGGKDGDSTLRLMHAFGERGYVALSIAYRLSDEALYPAAIEDCRLAVRWLRANAAKYHIDPDRIGAMGASAGGHLSAMLAVAADEKRFDGQGGLNEFSSAVQAAVPVCPPMDLTKPLSFKLGIANDEAVTRFLGGSAADNPEEAKWASPITYVRPGLPPMLIIHGDADRRVELVQSTDFAAKAKEVGAPCELIVVPGGKHGMGDARGPELSVRIMDFFDQHLKLAP